MIIMVNIKKILCFIFGHWHDKQHETDKIVNCDRCKTRIRAAFDSINAEMWYVKTN